MYIDPTENTGLSSKFVLNDSGGFSLVGGTEKSNDTIRMMLGFTGHFRVYAEDFVPPLLWLQQKPVAQVLGMKTYLVGKLTKLFSKYLNQITLESVTFDYDYTDRKQYTVKIDYLFKGSKEIKESFATFINI